MGKYFGTDGIRQKAECFDDAFLRKVCLGLSRYLGEGRHKVLIGGDTRQSTEWILQDLATGLESLGVEWGNVGVLPTPAINYVFYEMGFDAAIDVTASHNPYSDNGIKLLERGEKTGEKLSAAGVKNIEDVLDGADDFEVMGVEIQEDLHSDALDRYLEHLREFVNRKEPARFSGLKIGLDCANGATGVIGGKIFEELGAEVYAINTDTNYGTEINNGVGSTHIEKLQALVRERKLDLGAAFDGDGDRCIMVDENGKVIDGDQIIMVLAEYWKLPAVVGTVMSNQGFVKWGKDNKVEVLLSDVGDQNVKQLMKERGVVLGGEQSGHIILPGEAMGDGMLTALMMTKVVAETKTRLSELTKAFLKMPQVTKNVKVTPEQRATFVNSEDVKNLIKRAADDLTVQGGRLLVRPSGTEPVIRVTLWGNDEDVLQKMADEFGNKLLEKLNGRN